MRITQNLLSSNFQFNLRRINEKMQRLLDQTSTGDKFSEPSDDPTAFASSLDLQKDISFLDQFERNINNSKSQLDFLDSNLNNVNSLVQRARELAVKGANDTLSDEDRAAISQEVNQLLEQVTVLGNKQFSGRFIYGGFQTQSRAFQVNRLTADGSISSVDYQGDLGDIGRRLGTGNQMDVNLSGKEVFLGTTYTLEGRDLVQDKQLNMVGTFSVNDENINVERTDTITDIRDKINNAEANVIASVGETGALSIESRNSSREIEVQDLSGSVLKDLQIKPQGAFNIAENAPALPLIDSQGAIKTGDPVPTPLTIDDTNDRLVVELSGAANNGVSEAKSLILTHKTYNTVDELVTEIQTQADAEFGEDKLVVRNNAGQIELETAETGSQVQDFNLRVGGADDNGNTDTASVDLELTTAGGPEIADTGGTDGNDKFTIDLGPTATLSGNDPLPQLIDINADNVNNINDLVADINDKIRLNEKLQGQVEASNFNGRLKIETVKEGASVEAQDLAFANETPNTLSALGIETTREPPRVVGSLQYPPGTTVVPGANEFTIDLGPKLSKDGSNPEPQTIEVTPGTYNNIGSIVTEINNRIAANPTLFGQVEAAAGPNDELIIRGTKEGSRFQADELQLADVEAGTLANLGIAGPTQPGAGTSSGQGNVTQPDNLVDTLIQLRDDLRQSASGDTELVSAQGPDQGQLNIFPGSELTLQTAGNSKTINVNSVTTLDEVAGELEGLLGLGVKVDVTADGAIQIRNPQGVTISDIQVSLTNRFGEPNEDFNAMFESLNGDLLPGQTRTSQPFHDESRLKDVGDERLGEMSNRLTEVLNFRSVVGSRTNRAELTLKQLDTFRADLNQIKSRNDSVNMAETITELKETENVLRATLSVGSRIMQPSLIDFLQ